MLSLHVVLSGVLGYTCVGVSQLVDHWRSPANRVVQVFSGARGLKLICPCIIYDVAWVSLVMYVHVLTTSIP